MQRVGLERLARGLLAATRASARARKKSTAIEAAMMMKAAGVAATAWSRAPSSRCAASIDHHGRQHEQKARFRPAR